MKKSKAFLTGMVSVLLCSLAGAQESDKSDDLSLLQSDVSHAAEKPNVVFILTDDQGYADITAHDNPILKTPHIDKLREQSVRFADFSVSPCCAPTRCALLTGMHEFKSGVTHTISPYRNMNKDRVTIAQAMQSAGYATGHFGKWHLGAKNGYDPHERGFDIAVMVRGDSQKSHFNPTMLRNGKSEKIEGFRTDILFNEAMTFIESNRDKPFFCYLATYSPHGPLKCPPEYSAPYLKKVSGQQAAFFGMIANIDYNVDRLRKKLDELKLSENTLVVFMNDNGGTAGVDIWNANMRGTKGTPWRGGTRASSFWHLPDRFKPRDVTAMAAHIDVYPTLVELAGASLETKTRDALDGMSLLPLLTGKGDIERYNNRILFTHRGRWTTDPDDHKDVYVSVRWKAYQLVKATWDCLNPECETCKKMQSRFKGGKWAYSKDIKKHLKSTRDWELYDLSKDIGQENDIAAEHPETVEKLVAAFDQWWLDVRPMMINEPLAVAGDPGKIKKR